MPCCLIEIGFHRQTLVETTDDVFQISTIRVHSNVPNGDCGHVDRNSGDNRGDDGSLVRKAWTKSILTAHHVRAATGIYRNTIVGAVTIREDVPSVDQPVCELSHKSPPFSSDAWPDLPLGGLEKIALRIYRPSEGIRRCEFV